MKRQKWSHRVCGNTDFKLTEIIAEDGSLVLLVPDAALAAEIVADHNCLLNFPREILDNGVSATCVQFEKETLPCGAQISAELSLQKNGTYFVIGEADLSEVRRRGIFRTRVQYTAYDAASPQAALKKACFKLKEQLSMLDLMAKSA